MHGLRLRTLHLIVGELSQDTFAEYPESSAPASCLSVDTIRDPDNVTRQMINENL